MVRRFSIALGFGLVVLGVIAQRSGEPTWIYYLYYFAAIFAFVIAAFAKANSSQAFRMAAPLCLSAVLFGGAAFAYTKEFSPWVSRWDFALSVAFLFVGLGASRHGGFKHLVFKKKGIRQEEDDLSFLPPPLQGHRYAGGLGWGSMPVPDHRYYGSGLGWGTNPGQPTINHAGRGPKNYRRPDERINDEIHERLTVSPLIDATEILVEVKKGEVTLTGVVENRGARRIAEMIAESVFGVTEIMNHLETKKGKLHHVPPVAPYRVLME